MFSPLVEGCGYFGLQVRILRQKVYIICIYIVKVLVDSGIKRITVIYIDLVVRFSHRMSVPARVRTGISTSVQYE